MNMVHPEVYINNETIQKNIKSRMMIYNNNKKWSPNKYKSWNND